MLDDSEGPTTKREYQQMMVPGQHAPAVTCCAMLSPLLLRCQGLSGPALYSCVAPKSMLTAPLPCPLPTVCPPAVGEALVGQVVDFLGRSYPLHPPAPTPEAAAPSSSGGSSDAIPQQQQLAPIGADKQLPLLNGQPDMDSREQINQPLMTGVKVCVWRVWWPLRLCGVALCPAHIVC